MSQLHENPQDLQQVLEVTRAMAATTDLDELLALLVDKSLSLLQAERASVFLYDRQNDELVSRIATGVDEIRVPANQGISGATIQSGRTLLIPDAYQDPRFNRNVDLSTGFRTRNLISTPLRGHEGDLVGVLQVVNRVGGEFDERDVALAETFAAQAGVALQRANLLAHYQQKLVMERAMALAREIQQDLLPKKVPEPAGFDLAGFTRPAAQTGGDIYDFFPLPDGRCMVVVADATGHGIGPALVVSETRAMLRAVARKENALPELLEGVNALLTEDLNASRFVTCFVGILDPADGSISCISAGHGPIIHFRCEGNHAEEVPATGIPLGIMADATYTKVNRFVLAPGDGLLVTTDGFTEACNRKGDMFGTQRVLQLCRKLPRSTSMEWIQALREEVEAFSEGTAQKDDLTAVAIRQKTPGESSGA